MTSSTPPAVAERTHQLGLREHALALLIVGSIALVGNTVGPDIPITSAIPGMIIILAIAFAGVLLRRAIPAKIPTIMWISIVGIAVSTPWTPGSSWLVEQASQIDFLALATPILAYAGLGLARSEALRFARAGWRIIIVATLVFIGTYLGSALIAELVLSLTG